MFVDYKLEFFDKEIVIQGLGRMGRKGGWGLKRFLLYYNYNFIIEENVNFDLIQYYNVKI